MLLCVIEMLLYLIEKSAINIVSVLNDLVKQDVDMFTGRYMTVYCWK